MNYKVIKRDGLKEKFDYDKIESAVDRAFKSTAPWSKTGIPKEFKELLKKEFTKNNPTDESGKMIPLTVETIQDRIQNLLYKHGYRDVYDNYLIYRYEHKMTREYVRSQKEFIQHYMSSDNNANATVDDNSNVSCKNIGTLNSEAHKLDNIKTSRGMITDKLKELFPEFDHKQYVRDLESHICYKHDESSFAGPIAPYCVSATMYPFLTKGIQGLGGLSAAPQNLDSFCGIFINYVFAMSSQFAGAVATPEFFVCFDYYARKEWGDDYYLRLDEVITAPNVKRQMTIGGQIKQNFQQIIYSINQPTAARGMQSAFVNFAYFDKYFFDGMFGSFRFPDFTAPKWESVKWIQRFFMKWFNQERLRVVMTFPVESFALVYKDGKFLDEESADLVAEQYAEGHSFFTYISDTVDSLSSCCRLKNKLQTKEFNFTNGNMGVMTGSKSVITLNLNRILQDWYHSTCTEDISSNLWDWVRENFDSMRDYLNNILERIYKYHIAYNESLWDMYNAGLLPVYSAGFIDLNKQYLTIGINGLNEAAEFFEYQINDNPHYAEFCQNVFGIIKDANSAHNGVYNGHKLIFNTECVPAESLAAKNYNWDKADGYWVPQERNLYTSYIFLPSDDKTNIFEKIRMHGRRFIGDYLDGGSAAHINLAEHLSKPQYKKVLAYAAEEGCQYLTFNIPNSQCKECGFITKVPITKCPHCESEKIWYYDRVIGYLTRTDKWSAPRQIEGGKRIYEKVNQKDII